MVRGEAAAIEVWVNGAPLTAWSGPVAALSDITVRTALRRRHLGLYSWNAPTTFHSLRLRMLEGKATPDGDAVVADKASVE